MHDSDTRSSQLTPSANNMAILPAMPASSSSSHDAHGNPTPSTSANGGAPGDNESARSLPSTETPESPGYAPLATSRGFHRALGPTRTFPKRAKTAIFGFLHLPERVRMRIYELAIYDHDRTAVFLPRALPRKVEPGIDDVDLVWSHEDKVPAADIPPTMDMYEVQSSALEESPASGIWVVSTRVDAAEADFSNKQMRAEVHIRQNILDDGHVAVASTGDPQNIIAADATVASDFEDSDCDCRCHSASNYSSSDVSTASLDCCTCETISQIHAIPAVALCDCVCHTACRAHEAHIKSDVEDCCPCDNTECEFGCSDEDCHECRERQAFRRQQKSLDDSDVPESEYGEGEDCELDTDAYEHFDTDEQAGILYELLEPSILLASKDIRREALPLYYARNAFSWRFQWTDYPGSCKNFKEWAAAVTPDNLKLMTKISFEGRHVVEEGIEFSIDIDLLEKTPFFEVHVWGADDEIDIASMLKRETATYLWHLSRIERSRPVLDVSYMCDLANIFVQAMYRDAGGYLDDEAQACQSMLSPMF